MLSRRVLESSLTLSNSSRSEAGSCLAVAELDGLAVKAYNDQEADFASCMRLAGEPPVRLTASS